MTYSCCLGGLSVQNQILMSNTYTRQLLSQVVDNTLMKSDVAFQDGEHMYTN